MDILIMGIFRKSIGGAYGTLDAKLCLHQSLEVSHRLLLHAAC